VETDKLSTKGLGAKGTTSQSLKTDEFCNASRVISKREGRGEKVGGRRMLGEVLSQSFLLSRVSFMLGPAKHRTLDRPVSVSLEQLVPADHFYRQLDAALDLSVVRDWVVERYADRGRPSIDPVVFFRFHLIMFFEGIRSERQLVETASLKVAHRWYLGYHFDEPLPDRSSLIKIRQRLGIAIFRRFFDYVVDLCDEAGLIWGHELVADATRVPGNASMDSLVPRLSEVVDDHLEHIFDDGTTTGEASPDRGRWDLLETGRLDPERPPPAPIAESAIVRSVGLIRMPVPWCCATAEPFSATRTTIWSTEAVLESSSMRSRPREMSPRRTSWWTRSDARSSGGNGSPNG
jgi:transposase